MPEERIRVEIASGEAVTAVAYPAASERRADVTLILAPGAGANQSSDFMVRFAAGLALRGIDVVTFNFSYMERRRRVPDRTSALEACWRRVIEAVRSHAGMGRQPLAIGGKSMGGRIASQVVAAGAAGVAGLVLLGYPLHPPGKPDQLRVRHLPAIAVPMLIVQGSRDAFGTPEELRPILAGIDAPATLHVVEDGDHSFKVRKRSGSTQAAADAEIQDRIAAWLREVLLR